ncbi:MAG: hypothetical protein HY089_11540 [Ignavibacteriales bacterium]|nr:hypothetical protein [Ignavibacteriales bacterium]
MNTVLARTIGEEESIRLKDILASNIHPAIKAYFKAEVEQMLTQERQVELRSKKFPYSLPEITQLQQQMDLVLVRHYQFGQHDFDGLLDHAVHFQFNFLCRPQWTLLNFLFENQRKRSSSKILRKLQYCIDYVYFSEIIKRYIEQRGLAELTFEEFSTLLEKIDNEIIAAHSSAELALMARPMLSFIDAGQPVPRSKTTGPTIPINAAIVFFEDKRLEDIKIRLESERDKNHFNDVTLQQLADFIEKVRTGNEEAVAAPIAPQPASQPTNGDEDKKEITLIGGTGKKTTTPLIKKPPVKVFSDFEEDFAPVTAIKPPQELKPVDAVQNKVVKQESEELLSLFSESEQKTFVKKLFNREEDDFLNALTDLSKIEDWKQASLYLEQLFVANDVDPFCEEAILFTDKIQSRYTPSAGKQE